MTFEPSPEACHLETVATVHERGDTLYPLAPLAPGFWPAFTASPEAGDGGADPLDRYSKRLIGALARAWGGAAVFPSDGPPYPPFVAWALASGSVWTSPVGLLVDARQGLWLSFRGAVRMPGRRPLPIPAANPCTACPGQPCRTACPVAALAPDTYDLAACHAHLDTRAGDDCLAGGCRARRACPAGAQAGRSEDQSGFHMRAFHPR